MVDGTATVADVGRYYAKVADRIATHCKEWCYLNLSSEVVNRTSSKMWGK